MSSVPVISAGDTSVINMDHASAQRFEECLSKLTTIVERSGQPLSEISNHPAVSPLLRKMRTLVNQLDTGETVVEDNHNGTLATVTDISSRFRNR